LTKDELKRFESRLLEERGRIMKELGIFEDEVMNSTQRDSAGDLSAYSYHMADLGTDAMEREKAFQLASRDGQILHAVNDALRRLYNGHYGMCARCAKEIHPERLEVVPYTRLCSPCQEKEEKGRA
jgi:RNA polymerase-binding transcription factor DksA